MKKDRTAKCEKMSTLNVKSARSVKCENNSTLNVKQVLVSWMTSQMVSLANLVGLVSFSAFWGCGVSTFQKLKMLGSVMIFNIKCKLSIRKCVEMEPKNRCLHLITKNRLHFFLEVTFK